MHRHRTARTVVHRLESGLSRRVSEASFWLTPLLWILSSIAMLVDLLVPDPWDIEWGHLAAWFALLAIAVNSHALVRHVIARLTHVIALWHEDVHVDAPATKAKARLDVVPTRENVVPILRTQVTRARTGTDPS